jgi:hypothetical protein
MISGFTTTTTTTTTTKNNTLRSESTVTYYIFINIFYSEQVKIKL